MAAKEKINLLEVIPLPAVHTLQPKRKAMALLSSLFPRFKYEWMQRFLLPKGMSSDIHVHLEEHGTAVWEQIDGKSTIREIIEKLADHFNHEENYESRILAYFSQLQKDGFVKLTINE